MTEEGFQRFADYMCEDPQVPPPDDVLEPCEASDEEDSNDEEGYSLPEP